MIIVNPGVMAGHLQIAQFWFETLALTSATTQGFRLGREMVRTFEAAVSQIGAGVFGDTKEVLAALNSIEPLEAWSGGEGITNSINSGKTKKSETSVFKLQVHAAHIRKQLVPLLSQRMELQQAHADSDSEETATVDALHTADAALSLVLAAAAAAVSSELDKLGRSRFYENERHKPEQRPLHEVVDDAIKGMLPMTEFSFPAAEVGNIEPMLIAMHTRIKLIVRELRVVRHTHRPQQPVAELLREHLAMICHGTGAEDKTARGFHIVHSGAKELLFSARPSPLHLLPISYQDYHMISLLGRHVFRAGIITWHVVAHSRRPNYIESTATIVACEASTHLRRRWSSRRASGRSGRSTSFSCVRTSVNP